MGTKQQQFITDQLTVMLGEGKPYRAGALLLTYPSEKPGSVCQIAMGAALGKAEVEHALDFIQLIKGLRRLANELEARVEGRVPLTAEIVGDEV